MFDLLADIGESLHKNSCFDRAVCLDCFCSEELAVPESRRINYIVPEQECKEIYHLYDGDH